MSKNQGTSLFLLILLLALGAARSNAVQGFFKNGLSNISNNLGATAHGQAATSTDTLDWHLFLYWSIGAVLVLALSDIAPQITFGILFLIIVEELLLHWSTYAQLLQMPTK